MDELEKMKKAKTYLDKLANGIDPISDTIIPKNTILNNSRLSNCFSYVSGIIQRVIENKGIIKPIAKSYKKGFFITDKQKKSVGVKTPNCYISDYVKRINTVIEKNSCKKFQSRWLTEWLVQNGFMEEYINSANRKRKKVTSSGESIGFKTEIRNSANGNYPVTILNVHAQNFIIDSIDEIVSEAGLGKDEQTAEYSGKKWSAEHEEILIDLYKKEVQISEIAITLKRTKTGIRAKLKQLGIIQQRSNAE